MEFLIQLLELLALASVIAINVERWIQKKQVFFHNMG